MPLRWKDGSYDHLSWTDPQAQALKWKAVLRQARAVGQKAALDPMMSH